MSGESLDDRDVHVAWSLSVEAPASPRPSWLAPADEPTTMLVARPLNLVTEPSPSSPGPSIRVLPSVPSPSVAFVEPAPPSAPAYPDLRGENATLRDEITALRTALAELRRAVLLASEPQLVRLSYGIAERIVRRELSVDPALVLTWVRDAVEALAASDGLCLAVSPDLALVLDEETFRGAVTNLTTFEVDPALGPMRCEVRTRVARVDVSLEERLATISEELGVQQE